MGGCTVIDLQDLIDFLGIDRIQRRKLKSLGCLKPMGCIHLDIIEGFYICTVRGPIPMISLNKCPLSSFQEGVKMTQVRIARIIDQLHAIINANEINKIGN